MNKQPREKLASFEGAYDVHSIFYTIQGEGPYTGRPAIFIRLAGCNLQCVGCDTDYTSGRHWMSLLSINEKVVEKALDNISYLTPYPLAVITGGEPFRQDITPLVKELNRVGFPVQVETNGTLPIPKGLLDTQCEIVVSPKTSSVQKDVFDNCLAIKYVLSHMHVDINDGLPTRVLGRSGKDKIVARPPENFDLERIYVQPMDSGLPDVNILNTKAAIDSCMRYGYTLQIQIHKLIGLK